MTGQPLEKTGAKHAKLRAEWGVLARRVKGLIWLRQVIDELDKNRGDIPREFLLGWMAVESDGKVGTVTGRPERGYFQIDWKAGEAREQLGLSETQFKKLSTNRVFSIEKGIELAEKYRQWILTNHPSVPDQSELLWRLTKGRHAASGSLKGVLDRLVSQKTNITWATVSPLIPDFMRRNVDATLDYAAKLKPFADLVGAQAPAQHLDLHSPKSMASWRRGSRKATKRNSLKKSFAPRRRRRKSRTRSRSRFAGYARSRSGKTANTITAGRGC